jgi:hypothetical protein
MKGNTIEAHSKLLSFNCKKYYLKAQFWHLVSEELVPPKGVPNICMKTNSDGKQQLKKRNNLHLV